MLAIYGGAPVRRTPWPEWPEHGRAEARALESVARSGRWGGHPVPGPQAKRFAEAWAHYIGTRRCVLVSNGSVSLQIALRAVGIHAGDEIIVPALTWTATASAVVEVNAIPVFADVEPDTLCIDVAAVQRAITDRTKAVIAVHLGGSMADIDRLLELCDRHGLKLIEDCAHAHGMHWKGRPCGSLGHIGSFSFQSSKLLTCGEGGALTTNDEIVARRCQSIANCGRKEGEYSNFEGEVFGGNFRITEMQAALLSAQLGRLENQIARRDENLRCFEKRLGDLGDVGMTLQKRDPRITRHAFYQVILLYRARDWASLPRDRFVAALSAEGIPCAGPLYLPIQDCVDGLFALRARDYPQIRSRYGERLLPEHAPCPNASKAAYERTVWLHHSLFLGTPGDVDDILRAIKKIRENIDVLRRPSRRFISKWAGRVFRGIRLRP